MQTNIKYEFLEVIGEGSYGIVYKCRNKITGEFVAIKRFKQTEDPLIKKLIARELRLLQLVKHDNIIEYIECFKRNKDLFVVFEYIEKNLLQLLETEENTKGLDLESIKLLIYQLCSGINYLHNMGVIHRDIKPENLLIQNLNGYYKLKICDFGFAKKYSSMRIIKEPMTEYVATRWYRAPELVMTKGEYGPEVDYWAIGCIMAELIDGQPIFPGKDDLDQLNLIKATFGKFPLDYFEIFQDFSTIISSDVINYLNQSFDFEPLENKYKGLISDEGVTFLKGLLDIYPQSRLKGENALNHPFFDTIPYKKKSSEKIPNNYTLSDYPTIDNENTSNFNSTRTNTYGNYVENIEFSINNFQTVPEKNYRGQFNIESNRNGISILDKITINKFKNIKIVNNLFSTFRPKDTTVKNHSVDIIQKNKNTKFSKEEISKDFVLSSQIHKQLKTLLRNRKSTDLAVSKKDNVRLFSPSQIKNSGKDKFFTNTLFCKTEDNQIESPIIIKKESKLSLRNKLESNEETERRLLREKVQFYYLQEKNTKLSKSNTIGIKNNILLPKIKVNIKKV